MQKKILVNIFAIGIFIYCFLMCLVVNMPLKFATSYSDPALILVSDAILVLGHSINEDLTPSDLLENRLETALSLYNDGYAEKIIVSGGIGPTDKIPVAESMKTWLVENGVDTNSIHLEASANTTYENFKYSKDICDEFGYETILVVSNDFHIFRSFLIGKEFFKNTQFHFEYSPFNFEKFLGYLKEPFSIVKYYTIDFPKAFFINNAFNRLNTLYIF